MDNVFTLSHNSPLKDYNGLYMEFAIFFNKIFEDNGFEIRVEGDGYTIFFNGKDLCKALGYKNRKANFMAILKKVPRIYKRYLKDIITDEKKNDLKSKYNELKEVYLTEGGLYFLMFHSKTQKSLKLQEFIYTDFFPNLRRQQILLDKS